MPPHSAFARIQSRRRQAWPIERNRLLQSFNRCTTKPCKCDIYHLAFSASRCNHVSSSAYRYDHTTQAGEGDTMTLRKIYTDGRGRSRCARRCIGFAGERGRPVCRHEGSAGLRSGAVVDRVLCRRPHWRGLGKLQLQPPFVRRRLLGQKDCTETPLAAVSLAPRMTTADLTPTHPRNPADLNLDHRSDADAFGGVQFGYNFQSPGAFVYGIEVDLGGMSLNGNGRASGSTSWRETPSRRRGSETSPLL